MKQEISIYIHIPFCLSKCSYCDFFSVPLGDFEKKSDNINCGKSKIEAYFSALCNEIENRISILDNKIQCKTIYIGGGTPSLFSPEYIRLILEKISSCTQLKQDAEITIEVNPDDITAELLEEYEAIGINRISCGIQSMNHKILKSLNRRAGREENLSALRLLKNNWKGKLSLDLICGLPEESEKSFVSGLKEIISAEPDHISMYSLTIEEETPLGQAFEKGQVDYDFDFSDALWLKGREVLEQNGYLQYEVSNFCKPGNECNHNLTYWNHQDYMGFGAGATGTTYESDGSGVRITNRNNISKYIEFWNNSGLSENLKNNPKMTETVQSVEIVNKEISQFEYFMMGFRKLTGINSEEYKRIFGENIPEEKLKIFEKWNKNGLMNIKIQNTDNATDHQSDSLIYSLNSKGILFLNRLFEELI